MSLESAGSRRLAELRAELEGLQRAFNRYFAGLERTAPLAARDAFVVALRQASSEVRGSALNFQLQGLRASWSVHAARIERVLAQIDAGTYAPHRARAELVRGQGNAATTAPPAAPRAAPQAPGGAGAQAAPTDAAGETLARLHAAWTAAAAEAGKPVPSREAFAAVVGHKIAEARARSGHEEVEVRVVVERGLPTLQVTGVRRPGVDG